MHEQLQFMTTLPSRNYNYCLFFFILSFMLFVVVKKQVWVRYKKEMSCRKRSVSKLMYCFLWLFFFKWRQITRLTKLHLSQETKSRKLNSKKNENKCLPFGLSLIPPKYDGLREQIATVVIAYHLTAFHLPNDALCRVRTTKLAQHQPQSLTYCQRGNRAKKRSCLGGRFKIPRNVGKNSQILRNPLKFAFLTIFGCK